MLPPDSRGRLQPAAPAPSMSYDVAELGHSWDEVLELEVSGAIL